MRNGSSKCSSIVDFHVVDADDHASNAVAITSWVIFCLKVLRVRKELKPESTIRTIKGKLKNIFGRSRSECRIDVFTESGKIA